MQAGIEDSCAGGERIRQWAVALVDKDAIVLEDDGRASSAAMTETSPGERQ